MNPLFLQQTAKQTTFTRGSWPVVCLWYRVVGSAIPDISSDIQQKIHEYHGRPLIHLCASNTPKGLPSESKSELIFTISHDWKQTYLSSDQAF